MRITIEEGTDQSVEQVVQMALALWPDCDYQEEFDDFTRMLTSPKEAWFLSKENDQYTGFITLSLRNDYVEGATSKPIGYLEGIYVKAEFRKSGVGKFLVEKGEEWVRSKGCKDYCSDAEITNQSSIDFHKSLGFDEVNRIACFHKSL